MDTQDKILNIVLDTQESIKDLTQRVSHVEETQDKTFNRLDGFLTIIDRYESEISALKSKYERLEQRLSKLEMQTS